MREQNGFTLLEVLITIVVVGVMTVLLTRLDLQTRLSDLSANRLMNAGHAIETAIERERVLIASNPGKAKTPTAAAIPGNFPRPDTVWSDTDKNNNVVVRCSTFAARDRNGDTLTNVRMLKARAQIFAQKGGVSGTAKDTLTIFTSLSRFF
jgi:prepilin-type N-terminal cleavage/methylation domain-containing protein